MDEPADPFRARPDRTAELRSVLKDAAASVQGLVGSPEVAREWTRPSTLDGMTVGGLAAHIIVAVQMTSVMLERDRPDTERLASPLEFFGDNRRDGGTVLDDERARNIVAAAEIGGADGQDDVVTQLAVVVAEVDVALSGQPVGTTIATSRIPDARCRLDDYLLTRIAEVVLHGDDLATSVGVMWHPPVAAASATIEVLVGMSRERVGDLEVLRALAREERSVPGVLRAP